MGAIQFRCKACQKAFDAGHAGLYCPDCKMALMTMFPERIALIEALLSRIERLEDRIGELCDKE